MLFPKNYKYKKLQKPTEGRSKLEVKVNVLSYGLFGIKVLETGRVTNIELESCRRLILKRLKKLAKIYIIRFPDKFSTSKPLEVRMGKGKGNLKNWLYMAREGTILVELFVDSSYKKDVKKILEEASLRFSLKTKVVMYKI